MLALLKSPYTRRTLMCMSAAALLWSGSPAESTQAARYHKNSRTQLGQSCSRRQQRDCRR
ncbi:hypothetical protein ACFSQ7_09430 [Paenibacillus rhizoplanae]